MTLTVSLISLTTAEKTKSFLQKKRYPAEIVRLHHGETKRGCAYGVRTEGTEEEIRTLLHHGRIRYGEILRDDCHVHRGL